MYEWRFALDSVLVEIIAIYVFHFVSVGLGNPYVVLDHEVGKSLSIDQDYLLRDFFGIGDCGISKVTRSDENALVSLLPGQRSNEALNFSSFTAYSASAIVET